MLNFLKYFDIVLQRNFKVLDCAPLKFDKKHNDLQ